MFGSGSCLSVALKTDLRFTDSIISGALRALVAHRPLTRSLAHSLAVRIWCRPWRASPPVGSFEQSSLHNNHRQNQQPGRMTLHIQLLLEPPRAFFWPSECQLFDRLNTGAMLFEF
jgi:hypothetical protein